METAEIEVLVDELGERVERLRALYEQYFMGLEKIEPNVPRKDCDRRLWVLRREQIRNTGLRFKLNMIIQRYNTYQQYWQRITREIEAGTYKRDLRKVANRFGTEALTMQARKRFGKMIERTTDGTAAGSKGRSSYEDEEIDVEIDDFDSDQESVVQATASALHAADFGRIEQEPSDVMTTAPDFGMLDVGEPTRPVERTKTPFRPRPVPQRVPQPHADEQEEQTAPRLPAFGSEPAPPPSEPPSFPSGAVRAPLPPVATPPPHKPALISALAAPVRRAPALQKAPEPTPRQKPPEPTPRPDRPTPSSQAGVRPAPQPVAAPQQTPQPSAPPTQPSPPPLATQPSPPPHHVPQPLSPPQQPEAQRAFGKPAVPSRLATAPRPSPAAPAPRPDARPQPAAPRTAAAPQASALKAEPTPARNPPPPAGSEPGIAPARVRQLYESYVQARRACKESTSTITENGLAEMLRVSAEKLKDRHAGKDIDFDVVIKNGKAVLKPVIKGR